MFVDHATDVDVTWNPGLPLDGLCCGGQIPEPPYLAFCHLSAMLITPVSAARGWAEHVPGLWYSAWYLAEAR